MSRLDANFYGQIVLEAIKNIEYCSGRVVCIRFDGYSGNRKFACGSESVQTEPHNMSLYNTHPIFYINDTVHILK